MSDDILVRCCAINVVRRDAGALWADRTANRAIARKAQEVVLAALDGWLAPLLAERAAGCAVFDEIRMELTINPAELAGAAPFVRSRLRAQLAQALAAAAIVPAAADRMEHTGATNSGRKERPGEGPLADALLHPSRRAILEVLVQACEEGLLGFQLGLMRAPALLALAARLLIEAGEAAPALAVGADHPAGQPALSPLAHRATEALRTAIGALALELLLGKTKTAKGLTSSGGGPAAVAQVFSAALALSRTLEPPQESEDRQGRARPEPSLAKAAARPDAPDPSRKVHDARRPIPAAFSAQADDAGRWLGPGHHSCDSLLPFLMLQPLAHHRLFDGLNGGTDDIAAIAQALAWIASGEELGPDATRRTARLFANSMRELPGEQLLAAARRAGAGLDAQAAAAGALLLAGHRDGIPLLALPGDEGLLVVERDGLAPLALLRDDDLAAFAEASAVPLFLPPQSRGALAKLAAAGIGALCGGGPARGEDWLALRGPLGWIGTSTMEPARAAAAAAHALWLEEGIDRARAGWRSLHDTVLPVPPEARELGSLRSALAIVAGFALSEIGLALLRRDAGSWADPDPLLVRERYASLSGEIVVEDARVSVILPLGRRFIDLRDAGLLATQSSVPWWPGRRIEFTGA